MRIVIFGVSLILTLAIALPCGAFLIDPLYRMPKQTWVAVTDIVNLSSDGGPARFPIIVPWRDAWMRKPDLTWDTFSCVACPKVKKSSRCAT
jgi:hypothetical protein